jgi:hypothetical protein
MTRHFDIPPFNPEIVEAYKELLRNCKKNDLTIEDVIDRAPENVRDDLRAAVLDAHQQALLAYMKERQDKKRIEAWLKQNEAKGPTEIAIALDMKVSEVITSLKKRRSGRTSKGCV